MTVSPACIYHVLEGHIQEFVLTEVSRRAVDELFNSVEGWLSEATKNNPSNLYNPILVDTRVGLQPINYAFIQMRPFVNKYPSIRKVRIAMIMPPSPLLGTVSMVMRSVTHVRVYKPTEREQALAWLRQPASPSKSQL